MLFYSAWPLGFHNPEGERKARAFAESGYAVTYVAGLGIRNPRLRSIGKLRDRATRKLARGTRYVGGQSGIRTAAIAVLPPRQLGVLRRVNVAWVERQLRNAMPDLSEGVAWVRWPTPEVVEALVRLRPGVLVYECVDAYDHTPGITGTWAARFHRAEAALASAADEVVVPGAALAQRFRALGASVHVVPHGVEAFAWQLPCRRDDEAATAGFVGTLDYRLDLDVIREVARQRPGLRLRLIGPVQEGFDPRALADLTNVTVEPPIAHERLGETLASFDVGIMPYADHPVFEYMTPVKTLELMAAGKPAVTRASRALLPYEDLLYFADTPAEFVEQLDRAVAENTPERARERRAMAERNSWEARLGELRTIIQQAVDRKFGSVTS